MRTEIITIELRANSIIGRTGAPVSAAAPVTFLYGMFFQNLCSQTYPISSFLLELIDDFVS